MSYSVDDLVASLSSSHVGQEAMDLADLQTQLSQTLYHQQQQQAAWAQGSAHAPCNTPTQRTPSTSFANWSFHEHRRSRSSSSASAASRRGTLPEHDSEMIAEEDMEADDEYAVEQMVDVGFSSGPAYSGASSPTRYREREPLFVQTQQLTYAQAQGHPRYAYGSGADGVSTSPSVSTYAAQDPFFAAAEASSRQTHMPAQSSFFAQAGRPAQHSPFFAAHTAQAGASQAPFEAFAHPMDTRPRYVAAGGIDA